MTQRPGSASQRPDWTNIFRLLAPPASPANARRRVAGLPPMPATPLPLGRETPRSARRAPAAPAAAPGADDAWVNEMIEVANRVDQLKTQMRAIMPNARAEDIERSAYSFYNAMERNEINTPQRKAMFLANVAAETGDLKTYRESTSYRRGDPDPAHPGQYTNGLLGTFHKYFKPENVDLYMDPKTGRSLPTALDRAYAGRNGNGDEASGDGSRYRGGGALQLTGRENYRTVGKATGLDLENHPELLLDDWNAAISGAAYWKMRKINQLADAGNFDGVMQAVNGGTNGKDKRKAAYQRAQVVYGLTPPPPPAALRRRTAP